MESVVTYLKLSVMMFLQFGIYGLWLPIAGKFLTADPAMGGLGFSETQMGAIVGIAASVGALSSPFIVQFADRRFAAQRVLGVLMMIGGVLKIAVYPQSTFLAWLLLSVSFTLMFMPAAAICNALALRHLRHPEFVFPWVRLWTAVGWVVMGWSFSFLVLKTNVTGDWLPPFFQGDDVPMVMAEMRKSVLWSGVMAFGYGLWAFFFLPHSPPLPSQSRRPAVADAFALLKIPSIAVLLFVTLIISPMNTIYFMQCAKFLSESGFNSAHILPAMSVGQVCEILMYLILGGLLPLLGFKRILALGILAYALRFFLFGTHGVPMWLLITGLGIHGICYAFFTSTCFIYINKVAPKDVANTAQSVFNFIWYGIGPLLAVALNGVLAHFFASGDMFILAEFRPFWYSLGAISLVGLIAFLWKFRAEKEERAEPIWSARERTVAAKKACIGFVLALVGGLIIHSAFLQKKTDVYLVAECVPQAIVSPIFFLNWAYYSQEVSHTQLRALEQKGVPFDRAKNDFRASIWGVPMSASVTILFWLPFLIMRNKTGKGG